jgi:hypothetical protein
MINELGKADLLRRNNSKKSKFGNYSYDVIDIKSATLYSDYADSKPEKYAKKIVELQKSYGLQLWHYFEMLSAIQDSKPTLFLWVRDREGYQEIEFHDSILLSFKNKQPLHKVYQEIIQEIETLKEDEEIEPFKCTNVQ